MSTRNMIPETIAWGLALAIVFAIVAWGFVLALVLAIVFACGPWGQS